MKRLLVSYLLAIIAIILIVGCENPSEPEDDNFVFYGQIINKQGKPVQGAKIHYKSELKEKLLKGSNKICPSTLISFVIPKETHAEVKVYRWYSREYLFTLVNDNLKSGYYSYSSLPMNLTNGFYTYELTTEDTVYENIMYLQTVDWRILAQTDPLAITNSEGKFEIAIGVFGFDVEMKNYGYSGTSEPITMSISRTIEIVIYEGDETLPSLVKETTIEKNKNINKTFTINTTL
ncbi:MAG: hypothetical protein KKF62_18745 [Bacteroidetes bacterium]|nr:hypothetical protein [Bacteroidota bacterium]MBU1116896.1 hypothetical protein [Bacteroidota bacterium]MBU1797426.1 hypothetical protein [Bacteroidota bacterium]